VERLAERVEPVAEEERRRVTRRRVTSDLKQTMI
jgi:hypothetical protein